MPESVPPLNLRALCPRAQQVEVSMHMGFFGIGFGFPQTQLGNPPPTNYHLLRPKYPLVPALHGGFPKFVIAFCLSLCKDSSILASVLMKKT